MSDPRRNFNVRRPDFSWVEYDKECEGIVDDYDGPAVDESEHDAETESEDAR